MCRVPTVNGTDSRGIVGYDNAIIVFNKEVFLFIFWIGRVLEEL